MDQAAVAGMATERCEWCGLPLAGPRSSSTRTSPRRHARSAGGDELPLEEAAIQAATEEDCEGNPLDPEGHAAWTGNDGQRWLAWRDAWIAEKTNKKSG